MKSSTLFLSRWVAAGFFGLTLAAATAGPLSPWPLPEIPPGANPAAVPSPPRTAKPPTEWMAHFERNEEQARHGPVNLIFDGASIMSFWPTHGKEAWEKNYAKLGAADFGIPGDLTENLLWRLEDGQVDGLHPKLVALMVGLNNLHRDNDDRIIEGLQKIIDEYERRIPEATILLQGLLPAGNPPDDPRRARIKGLNARMGKLADGKRVLFVDFGDKLLEPDGSITHEMMPDGIHPTARGYEIWAAAIAPIIQQFYGEKP